MKFDYIPTTTMPYWEVCAQLYDAKVEVEQLRAERDQLHTIARRVVALDDLAIHHAPRAKAKRRAAIQALAELVDPT